MLTGRPHQGDASCALRHAWPWLGRRVAVGWVGGGEDGLGFDGGLIGMLVCSAMRVGRARRVEVVTRRESIKTASNHVAARVIVSLG